MLITFFIIMFLSAIGALILGAKTQRWILCAGASVLFLVLAFSAFRIEVPTGGITIVFQEIVIVMVCWAGAIISMIFTLVGMVSYVRAVLGKKEKEQQGIGG